MKLLGFTFFLVLATVDLVVSRNLRSLASESNKETLSVSVTDFQRNSIGRATIRGERRKRLNAESEKKEEEEEEEEEIEELEERVDDIQEDGEYGEGATDAFDEDDAAPDLSVGAEGEGVTDEDDDDDDDEEEEDEEDEEDISARRLQNKWDVFKSYANSPNKPPQYAKRNVRHAIREYLTSNQLMMAAKRTGPDNSADMFDANWSGLKKTGR